MNRHVWLVILAYIFVACSNAPLSETESHFAEPRSIMEASSLVDEYLDSSHSNNSEEPRLIVPKQIRLTGVGSTYQLEPQVIGAKAVAFRYVSETESMVKINDTGTIEITGGGFCNVYVLAQLESGFWIFEEISIVSPSAEQRVFFE